MWCAYLFAGLAFVALPTAIHNGSPTVLVNWVSSNFLQLILLPIIMVGQAQHADSLADLHQKHDALSEKLDGS